MVCDDAVGEGKGWHAYRVSRFMVRHFLLEGKYKFVSVTVENAYVEFDHCFDSSRDLMSSCKLITH